MFSPDIRIDRIEFVSMYKRRYQPGTVNDYSTKLRHCELIYKFNGTSQVTFGDETFPETGKSVRFLPVTGQMCTYICKTLEPCDYIYFAFDGTGLPDRMIHYGLNGDSIGQLFLRLYRTWTMRQNGYYLRSLSFVYEILSELEMRQSPDYLPENKYVLLRPALDYIENHLTDDIDFSSLHTLCELSYTYFKQLFLQKYGVPPVRRVTRLRMELACEYLTAGMLTVSEIAETLGYSNVYYFSRVFRREVGCSATEYRKDPNGRTLT